MITATVQVLALSLFAAGMYSFFGLTWALRGVPPRLYLEVMQAVLKRFKNEIPPVIVSAFVSAAAVAVLLRGDPLRLTLAIAACLTLAAVTLITKRINEPINDQVEKMDMRAPPPEWERLLARWRRFNFVRVLLGVAGFFALSASIVLGGVPS